MTIPTILLIIIIVGGALGEIIYLLRDKIFKKNKKEIKQ